MAGVDILTVEGDMISRCEIFDEAGLDAALARFDELQPQARRLENAASQVCERFREHFAAREWAAMAEADSRRHSSDDRRRVVGGGIRRGRDAQIADMRGVAEVVHHISDADRHSDPWSAPRPHSHHRLSFRGQGRGEFTPICSPSLRSTATTGSSQPSGSTSTTSTPPSRSSTPATSPARRPPTRTRGRSYRGHAAFNRHEFSRRADWVNIDHRRGRAFVPGDLTAYIRATYDFAPNTRATSKLCTG